MGDHREEIKRLLEKAAWYHTIELPDGQSSNGSYDHRKHLDYYRLPASLEGQEVLDVGCADGFFSFEMERRGAKSVLAVDINKADGTVGSAHSPIHTKDFKEKYTSFQSQNSEFDGLARSMGLSHAHLILMAKSLLKSEVRYQECSVYKLESLNRTFDTVFCGDLIEHLKNPVEAVEQLAKATKTLCIITIASLSAAKTAPLWLSILKFNPLFRDRVVAYWGDRGGTFFHFTPPAFARLARASGFSKVETVSRFDLRNHKTGLDVPHVVYHCWK